MHRKCHFVFLFLRNNRPQRAMNRRAMLLLTASSARSIVCTSVHCKSSVEASVFGLNSQHFAIRMATSVCSPKSFRKRFG